MKFNNFPYLVQKEIFANLTISDVLIWSHVSKNQKLLFQSISKSLRPQGINYISYKLKLENCTISVKNNSTSNHVVVLELMEVPSDQKRSKGKKMHLFGRECHTIQNSEYLSIFCAYDKVVPTLEAIHDELYYLFGTNKFIFELKTKFGRYVLPKLHNIKSAALGFERPPRVKNVQEFFQLSPRIDCLTLYNEWGTVKTILNHLEEIRELHVWFCCHCATLLENFNGKIFTITCTYFRCDEIVQFLKKWKSNEKYQNLEYFEVDWNNIDLTLGLAQVKEQIEIKEFDEKDIMPEHPSRIRYSPPFYEEFWTRCTFFSSRFYIERDSDGHVAYIAISYSKIKFAVWDMTVEKLSDYKCSKNLGR